MLRNDRPLIVAVAIVAGLLITAWLKTSPPPVSAITAADASPVTPVAAQPADYTAPPLSATTTTPVPKAGTAVDIVRDPADLPAPVGNRGARRITVDLTTEEVTGTLANGTTFHYWTFNGKVPGPFVRVRVGDVVTVRLKNDAASMMMHNVDLHAVMGPGGGAQASAAGPRPRRRGRARARASPSRPPRQAFSFITARRCPMPNTSPTACTA